MATQMAAALRAKLCKLAKARRRHNTHNPIVDRQSTYSAQDLVSGLAALMNTYDPTDIRTQANYISQQYPDTADHMQLAAL